MNTSQPDPTRFEYRFRPMAAMTHSHRPRSPLHYRRAAMGALVDEPLLLDAGNTIDHVLHHIVPGKAGDHQERHGPYAFWLLAEAPHGAVVETSLGQEPSQQLELPPTVDRQWHHLGALHLQGRVPRLAVAHRGGAAVTCHHLLFTDDARFEPRGSVAQVEARIYGVGHDQLGRTTLTPDDITVGDTIDLDYSYIAGPAGIAPGGGLRWRWPAKDGRLLQRDDPDAPLFLAVDGPAGVRLELTVPTERAPSCREQMITLRLTGTALRARDAVRAYVRRFRPFLVVPEPYMHNESIHWWTPLVPLATEVDHDGRGVYVALPEASAHRFRMKAGPPHRLHVACPAMPNLAPVTPNAAASLDHFDNPLGHPNPAALEWAEPLGTGPGVHRGRVRDASSGLDSAVGPVWLAGEREAPLRVFFGDLHGHSILSDGVGDAAGYLRHGRDVAGLDFCSSAEHICYLSDNDWRHVVNDVNRANEPGRFVTLVAYEWAGMGGHHCLYTKDDWLEPVRGMEPPCDAMPALWSHFRGQEGSVLATTHSCVQSPGLKTCWDDHDFAFFRSIEIFTRGGAHEYFGHPIAPGSTAGIGYQEMLSRGARLGVIAGSDNHEARPGLTSANWGHRRRGGLACVWAPALTRRDIFDALYARHTYGTTGQRTIVQFFVNGAMMGDQTPLDRGRNRIELRVHATSPIEKLEIVADAQVVAAWSDLPEDVVTSYDDTENRPDYYYLRLRQQDGHYAWSSPVFSRQGEISSQ